MSLITYGKENHMRILSSIQDGINDRELLYIVRIFNSKTTKWERRVLPRTQVEEFFGSDDLLSGVRDIIGSISSDRIRSQKLADLRDLNIEGNIQKVVLEVLQEKINLLVCGAGHVGQAVGLIGSLLGYSVIIVDDRPEFATRKRFPDPGICLIVGDYSHVLKNIKVNSSSAIVIVTRGHQFDEMCLRELIGTKMGYLGMIGSKRRTISVVNKLREDGFSEVVCKKLHAPIGLQIGAR